MSFHDEKHVITSPAMLLWNGINNPNTNDSGKQNWSVKVAIPANDPCLAELDKIARDCLNASEFKGTLPHGGIWPFKPVDANDIATFGPLVNNHVIINAKTFKGAPQVFDMAQNQLNPMTYASQLYAGSKVSILVHCYAFNDKSKGVTFGLDGLQIVDAHAPQLDVGGGLTQAEVASAFGGKPGATAAGTTPPVMGAPSAPVGTVASVPNGPAAGIAPPPSAPHAGIMPPPTGTVSPPPAPTPQDRMIATDGTYDQYIAANWTEAQLIAAGKMRAA